MTPEVMTELRVLYDRWLDEDPLSYGYQRILDRVNELMTQYPELQDNYLPTP